MEVGATMQDGSEPPPAAPGSADRCRTWRGHVIVCGLHGVGLRTVEQLHLTGVPVVVVDDDPNAHLGRTVDAWGVPRLVGDGRQRDVLFAAGLAGAIAVICVQRDELHKLETALRIRELRPDVRVVSQLANPEVAGALARVTGPGSVLDAAELAAPSFVEACLARGAHDLDLGSERFRVVELEIRPEPSGHDTFRGHFGNLAPVAIVPAGRPSAEMAVCPGRDHPAGPGDRVTVLGPAAELERAGIRRSQVEPGGGPPELGRLTRAWRQLRAVVRSSTNRAFPVALAALVLLVALAVVVVRLGLRTPGGHHLDFLTALYFTVETVATVGYGDYSFYHQAPWLLIFGVVLIVLGVALVSTVFALFTNLLVSRRIEQSLGTRRRVPGITGHVIVVGFGAVGLRVVEGLLAEGERVVVVERDRDNRYLARARALGVPVVVADSTQRQTFRAVNLDEARAVAVLTSNDLTNIEIGLAARESLGDRRGAVPVVLRVFDRELARTVGSSFGFRHVRSTSALAAPWFIGAALGLDVLQTFYVEQQPFLVARITVAAGGGLEGLAMQDLGVRTRVVALSRDAADGRLEHPPRRGTRFAAGDRAYVLGPYEELLAVLQRDREQRPDQGMPPSTRSTAPVV